MNALAEMFGSFGTTVFRWAAVAFLLLNGGAAAAVVLTRSQALVNRWTGRLVAANLLLLGVGVGVPAVALCLKTVVRAVAAAESTQVQVTAEPR
ncbi:MAG: hypothetical protein R2882_14820 [Gemmatimonadales bacterium]